MLKFPVDGTTMQGHGVGNTKGTSYMITIDDGVPLPAPAQTRARHRGLVREGLLALDVGQSFRIEQFEINAFKVQCSRIGKQVGRKFTIGTDDEGGRRVWRES